MAAPTVVYRNRVCEVVELPGGAGLEVRRLEDGLVVAAYSEASLVSTVSARAMADTVAGPVGRRPPEPPPPPPSGVHPDAGTAGAHPRREIGG